MDTEHFRRALEEYRRSTGDSRPYDLLPASVQSKIARDAQLFKAGAASKNIIAHYFSNVLSWFRFRS